MLFDLRGRGRRRTVQVIYLSLAILMGGGLILFGIGGNFSGGGLFDAIGLTGGGDGGGDNQLEDLETTAQERVQANPRNAAAWAELARIRVQLAGQGEENFDQNTGEFKEGARDELQGAATAWKRYLALEPPRPNPDVAVLMTRAFQGLNQPAEGVTAAEIAAEADPNSNNFFTLALFAYQAGQTRKGDLAARRSVSLAPAAQRKQVKQLLDQIKQNPTGQQQGQTTQPATPLG